MKKNYSTFSFVKTLMVFAALMMVSAQAFAQSCVGNINVSLDGTTCTATITAADVSGSAGVVTVNRNDGNGWVVATLVKGDVGKRFQYQLTAGAGSCWGNVTVEDKSVPLIAVPVNVPMACDDANAVDLTAAGPTAIPVPAVTDCSTVTVTRADAVLLNSTCPPASYAAIIAAEGIPYPVGVFGALVVPANTIKIVRRVYTAKDFYGNINVSRPQYIFITRTAPTVPASFSANATVLCSTTPAAAPTTAVNLACGVTIKFLNDLRVDLCGNTYKLVRTWQVTDLCSATTTMASNVTQIITVIDPTTPALTVSGTSYDLAAAPAFAICNEPNFVPNQVRATLKTTTAGAQGTLAAPVVSSTGTLDVTAWGDNTMCGAGSISLTATSTDNCANDVITVSDSRFEIVNGVIKNKPNVLIMGNTSFDVVATDKCGNATKITVNVKIIDNISPTAICDGVTATLNNYRTAVIRGESFDHSSNDNCGIVRILVAKNVNGTVPTTWCDNVTYGCTDLGVATLKVWIRYIDAAGNYTDCCVPLTIVDKATISCASVQGPTIPCNDPRLINVSSLFTAPSTFYDGCSTPVVKIEDTNSAISCGSGSFTRTYTYTISNSITTAQSVTCTQSVTVTPVRGFRVTRLPNQDVTCAGAVSTLKQDQDAIIASMQLLHTGTGTFGTPGTPGNGEFTGNLKLVPVAGYTTCAAPVVDTTESIYRNSIYCKVLVRTFVVKDLCEFSLLESSVTQGNEYNIVGVAGSLVAQSIWDADGRHYIKFTRTIRILDNTAPTSTPPVVADVCSTSSTCNFGFNSTLRGNDGCGDSTIVGANLFYTWRIVNAAGVTVDAGNGTTVNATGLAFGTYTVFYRVSDLCGNISTEYKYTATGKDCKAPEILVHNKIVELAGQRGSGTGMARLLYKDIRNRIYDNCELDLTTSNKIVLERGGVTTATRPVSLVSNAGDNPLTDGIMLTCDDRNTIVKVRVWAVDANLNWNYAISDITVQDNIGSCTVTAQAGGLVGTENGSVVKDVVVSANANGLVAAAATSNAAGAYEVTGLTVGTNYQVRAVKTIDTDKKNGVTSLDIALISKHLLGETNLNSAHKIIAADVDKNSELEATDMLHIRRFILGITPNLAGNAAWRFVDKAYTFRNATNPLGEDFPEVVSLSSIPAGRSAANFTAVKLGDVNNSYDAATVRGSRALSFSANDRDVVAGNEYTVAIDAANFNASAFQGTFAFEGATVKAVKAGNLNNTSDNNFGMFSNAVSASWNGKSEATANVVNITFVATKSGLLSEMLTVNSSVTMAEGYDAAGNAMNVSLKFNTGKVAGGEFALYQNTPNPVAASTTIGFNLPKDGQAKLTIYTAEGKVLSVINNTYKAGVNQIAINKSDLNASGMLYYRLDTQDNSSTRKMIIIE